MRVLVTIFCATELLITVACRDGGQTPARASADTTFVSEPVAIEQSTAAVADLYARLTYSQRRGKLIFEKYCVVCHGSEGRGDGFNAYNLDPRPRDLTDSTYMAALADERLVETIREGGRRFNKSILMPAWGNTLTPNQIEDGVNYIRALTLLTSNE